MSDEQMLADYRRDQDAVRKCHAAVRALREVLDLPQPLSHTTKGEVEGLIRKLESRAEQKQAVWN